MTMILVSGATKTVRQFKGHPNLGVLITPHTGNALPFDMPYACDNAAFSNWQLTAFLKMLDRLADHPVKPMFVTAPDVVGNSRVTRKLFEGRHLYRSEFSKKYERTRVSHKLRYVETLSPIRGWSERIRERGLKVAYCLQNGTEEIGLPNPRYYDALFIGGDNQYKLSQHVRWQVMRAKEQGVHIHMGRVNTARRLQYAFEIGCDTVDGTGVSMFPDQNLPKLLRHLEGGQQELFAGKQYFDCVKPSFCAPKPHIWQQYQEQTSFPEPSQEIS